MAIGPFIFNCGGYGSPQNVILANKDASRFLSFKKVSALWRAVLRTINDNMVCILASIALSFLQGRKNRKGLTCWRYLWDQSFTIVLTLRFYVNSMQKNNNNKKIPGLVQACLCAPMFILQILRFMSNNINGKIARFWLAESSAVQV